MKRIWLLGFILVLVTMLAACGGTSGSGNVGASQVSINVGNSGKTASLGINKNSFFARLGKIITNAVTPGSATAAIPSDVTHILFTISAPDMTTISRDVPIAGQESISETFSVPNGQNRHFVIEAMNESGRVVYQPIRDYYINLDGQPQTISIDMKDVATPSFSGAQSATAISTTQINLAWSPATDNLSASSNITYQIYLATTSGGQIFSTPSFTTSPGVTSYAVTGLQPNTTYYVVVRATDSGGNQDTNTVERSATTFLPPDTTPPTFAGLVSATSSATVFGSVDLSWNAASDDRTTPSNLIYHIYMATTSGGQNFTSPNFTTTAGTTSYSITGLSAGTYYFVVRARDEAGNVDTNTVERTATVQDTSPPVFSGATGTTINYPYLELSWPPASDNVTAANAIVYRIYIYPYRHREGSPPILTVSDIVQSQYLLQTTYTGLTSVSLTTSDYSFDCSHDYYLAIKAVDQAGNVSANTDILGPFMTPSGC